MLGPTMLPQDPSLWAFIDFFLKDLKRVLKVSNFLGLHDMISCSPKCKLKYKRRKSHRALQRYAMVDVFDQAVSFDSLAAPWITPSPCSIPITPPALAALLNKTDAPVNPTRSLLYTVNYLWHLLTQYSFEISRWWQRSKQWRSHRPLHTWAASALLQWTGRVLPVLTQQPCSDVVYRGRNSLQKHDIALARVFPPPVFYFWFSSLVWKLGGSGRKMCPKSASVQSHLGRKQAIQQAENSRGEEVRASEAEDASPGIQLKHCFAASRSQKENYSKKP